MNAPTLLPSMQGGPFDWLLDQSSNGLLMSGDEFARLTHDDCDPAFRYELINGVVIVSPPPDDAGQGPNERLGNWLWDYQQRHPTGKVLDDTLMERPVSTRVGTRVVDRALWIGFGRPIHSKSDLPTIIVEFVSAGRRAWQRDYEQKRDEFVEMGCKEYWTFDRFHRTLTVHYALGAAPPQRVITEQEIYTTPLLPGFELPLRKLLELADQYAIEE